MVRGASENHMVSYIFPLDPGYLAQAEGLLTTDASRASFLSAITVLVVPVLAGLSGRGITTITWFSSAAAFLGVGLLEGGVSSFCIGDFWQLVSAFAFGVQVTLTKGTWHLTCSHQIMEITTYLVTASSCLCQQYASASRNQDSSCTKPFWV